VTSLETAGAQNDSWSKKTSKSISKRNEAIFSKKYYIKLLSAKYVTFIPADHFGGVDRPLGVPRESNEKREVN